MGPAQLAVEDKKHLGPVQILRFPQVVKLVYQTIQGKNKHTISNDTIYIIIHDMAWFTHLQSGLVEVVK